MQAFAYLMGFQMFNRGEKALNKLATRIATEISGNSVKSPTADPDTVSACLNRGWGTELLLNASYRLANEDELVKLSNSWGAVQLYYVSYAASQALIVAEGQPRPSSHQGTKNKIENLWVTRKFDVPPWSFAIGSATSRKADADGAINGPGRRLNTGVHSWEQCTSSSCWDLAASAITSTRANALDVKLKKLRAEKLSANKKAWGKEEGDRLAAGKKPRKSPPFRTANLSPAEKAGAEANLRPYTMVDYLYRLRVKANYEDARMFTDGPETPTESELVSGTLVDLAAGTLLAHELRVGQLLGKKWMMTQVDKWVNANVPPAEKYGLQLRRDILDQHL